MYRRSFVALLAALSLAGCNTPTQVTVEVTTDIPCDRLKGADVMVGTVDDIEKKNAASSSTVCEATGTVNSLGSIVLIPTDTKNDEFTIKVVGGVDIEAEKCRLPENASRCITARRTLKFIPHTKLTLPIFLSSACEGVPCTDRTNETCVLGVCVPATIGNPAQCETPGACGDGVLTGEDNTPPFQDPIACGRPSVIADDFETKDPLGHWAVEGFVEGAAQVDGELVLSPPPDKEGEVRYRSDHAVNLDGDAITVKVPAIVDPAPEFRAYLSAALDDANHLTIEHRAGQLWFLSAGMGGTTSSSVTYDPKKHVWWEIRSTPQNIVLRTSPDGFDWNPGASVPRASVAHIVENAHIVLGAGIKGTWGNPGKVTFDNLNQGRPPIPWCSLDAIEDTFDGMETLPKWRRDKLDNDNCTMTQEGGDLVFTTNGAAPADCSYRSRTAFDMTGKSIVMDLESFSPGIQPEMNFFLSVEDDQTGGAEIGLRVSQTPGIENMPVIHFARRVSSGAQPPGEVPIPMDTQIKYFRLREQDEKFYWETSVNGKDWLIHLSDTPGFGTKAVHVIVRLQAFLQGPPVTVKVEDLAVDGSP